MNIRTEYRCNHCNGEFPKVARVGLQCDETLRGLDDRRICEACFDYLVARPDLNDSERTQLQSAGRIAESYDSSIKAGVNPDTGDRFPSYGHQMGFLEAGLAELHGEGSHKGDFIGACPTCRDEELDLIAEEDKNTNPYTGETFTEVAEARKEAAEMLRRSGDYEGAAAIEGEPNAFTEMAEERQQEPEQKPIERIVDSVLVEWSEGNALEGEKVTMSVREFRGLLLELSQEHFREFGLDAGCYYKTKVIPLDGDGNAIFPHAFRLDVNGLLASISLPSSWKLK